ncbi:MAG TPA: hypothetical protein VMW23_00840 [Sedimentisphaerales bacterium]|nr:hypothetical protein [Sedimentisphaerales bacterium]
MVILLFYKPSAVNRLAPVDTNQVSPYLTHILLPRLYNAAQLGEPFEMVVTATGINDIIRGSQWPKQVGDITLTAAAVTFAPDKIILVMPITIDAVELVVTVTAQPRIDQQGLLNIIIAKVKVGAVNITPLARLAAQRVYSQLLADNGASPQDFTSKLIASLLAGQSFEPVFEIDDMFDNETRNLRITSITITQGKLTVSLMPAAGPAADSSSKARVD